MRIAVLIATFALFAACKKAPSPAQVEQPGAPVSLPMPPDRAAPQDEAHAQMKKLDALVDADVRHAERNRRLMVTPAPTDFQPEAVTRKIRLTLALEKTKLRVGENPRYRLELTNVGRETINYIEYDSSVFRWGGLFDSVKTIKFLLTDKAGKRRRLRPSLAVGRAQPFTARAGPLSAEEEADSKASTTFEVKLLPGETLRSFGDGNSPTEPFRTMLDRKGFNVPGLYRIHVELDDRPDPLTDSFIKLTSKFQTEAETRKFHAKQVADALGPVSSNIVILEIQK